MTNKWRFRVNWRGKVILQRLHKMRTGQYMDWWEYKWYDATSTDLADFYKVNKE